MPKGHEEPTRLPFVLVAGTLTSLSRDIPAALLPVARHLFAAEQHLGFAWRGIRVWHPARRELDAIRFGALFRSENALWDFLWRFDAAKHCLSDFTRPGPPPKRKPDVAGIYLSGLKEPPPEAPDPFGLNCVQRKPKTKGPTYKSVVDDHFVRPIVERALRSRQPEERAIDASLAMTTSAVHEMMPAVFDSLRGCGERLGQADGALLPPEAFGQLMALVEKQIKLVRERGALRDQKWGAK